MKPVYTTKRINHLESDTPKTLIVPKIEKPEAKRTYDENGYRHRAVAIVRNDKNEILLASSIKYENSFILPGGGIDENELPERAVVREVLEEAGVEAEIEYFLCELIYDEKKQHIWLFQLKSISETDDHLDKQMFGRCRKWVSLQEARERLLFSKPVQLQILDLLKN